MATKNKKRFIILGILILIIILYAVISRTIKNGKTASDVTKQIINPSIETIATYISTTGTVYPQNRLEIKPPIAGRVEKILVKEGDIVKAGQILIWMSSTERAALIDAARSQGESQVKYWEDVYKPIPISAPISGTIIARSLEPGQSAQITSVILVISDRLFVKANVDETDVGKVKIGQHSEISLDAYPDVKVDGHVQFVKFESTTVNNVTTYEVDITPVTIPSIFKSGMSANIKIYEKIKKDVLSLPNDAIKNADGMTFVNVVNASGQTETRPVVVGLEDDQNTEIVSGISADDKIVLSEQNYIPPADVTTGTSPFMQQGPRRQGTSSSSSSSSSKSKSSTSTQGPPEGMGSPPGGGGPPGM